MSIDLPVLEISRKWDLALVAFRLTDFLTDIIFSKSTHVVACVALHSVLLLNTALFCVWRTSHFVYPVTSWQTSGLFPLLGCSGEPARTFVFAFFCGLILGILLDIYLGVELPSHMLSLCLALKTKTTCQTVFQSVCTILHSHEHCMRVSTSLLSLQHLSLFFITTILVVVKWCLTSSTWNALPFPALLHKLKICLWSSTFSTKPFLDLPQPEVIIPFLKILWNIAYIPLVVCLFPLCFISLYVCFI